MKITTKAISANNVTIPHSKLQTVKYEYNEETKTYTRYARKRVQTDYITGEPVTTKNIIITMCDNYTLKDSENKGRQGLKNIGTFDGYYITNRGNAGFTDEERGKMTELLDAGFTDSFRYLYPDKTEAYTWWSYMGRAREKNIGWRIDYFITSKDIEKNIKDATIYPEVYGSDHCPVGLEIEI